MAPHRRGTPARIRGRAFNPRPRPSAAHAGSIIGGTIRLLLHSKQASEMCWLADPPDCLLTLDITPGFILTCVAETVHIGKAAMLADISVDTIRFYQKLGLIKGANRSASGYRLFN